MLTNSFDNEQWKPRPQFSKSNFWGHYSAGRRFMDIALGQLAIALEPWYNRILEKYPHPLVFETLFTTKEVPK